MTSTSSLADDPTIAVRSSLDAIDRLDSAIGAFVTLDENAERAAEDLRVESTQGHPRSALHGVPIGVKELFDVADTEVTYGSLVLAGRRATADAAIVAALRRAGAVVVGTTRSDEFGWGITTQNAERGSTRNPWDLDRIAGGSSGGSAAAVAAGMVPLAVASDTGGSIRIPASFCGVYGLKTTPGRISRTGGVPLAPSFDSPGFVTSDPTLFHAALAAVVGPDPADPPTLEAPTLEASGGALGLERNELRRRGPAGGSSARRNTPRRRRHRVRGTGRARCPPTRGAASRRPVPLRDVRSIADGGGLRRACVGARHLPGAGGDVRG